MPLFMDYHKGHDISVDDVKKAHMADRAIQEKYGVNYRQFWVNEKEGTIFCLMEGPDTEACAAVHREAHGNMACNIIPVRQDMYDRMMGEPLHVDNGGLVVKNDGNADTGVRTLMILDIRGQTRASHPTDFSLLRLPTEARRIALRTIHKFKGRQIKSTDDDNLTAIFNSCLDAVRSALEIKKTFEEKMSSPNKEWALFFKIALSAGQPVTDSKDMFNDAYKLAQIVCLTTNNSEIKTTSMVKIHAGQEIKKNHENNLLEKVEILSDSEEAFMSQLYKITNINIKNGCYSVEQLRRHIGMSRPQLYKNVNRLTGRSPNEFIQDMQLRRAFKLMTHENLQISEVASAVGFSNISHFVRCFQKSFGYKPSQLISDK